MMMFGGSPISVAVPPMLDAITSMITSGIASMSSASASRNVIGTIRRTVVRLSRNADSSAVVPASASTTASGRPRESCPALIARYVYTPVVSVRRTMIIIPARSPIVLKSIASMACSCSSVWVTTISPAPRSATLVRSIRSLAITPSATTKMATASATSA